MGRILVGIDGSESSQRALAWAIDEAQLRNADVHVVHAYKTEYLFYADVPATAIAIPRAEVEAAAEAMVKQAVEAAATEGVIIDAECVNSANPAGELVERSGDAELIVLGTRGLGGLRGLLLGSVTLKVAQQSRCPVVIVPAHAGDDE